MTQTEEVIKLLKKNPTLSNIELANLTGFPQPSIRRITGTLTKQGILNRIKKGVFDLNPDTIINRHYISTSFYCSGNLEEQYAESFTFDNIDIFNELKTQLEKRRFEKDECGEIAMVEKGIKAVSKSDYNYSINIISFQDSNKKAIYPNINTSFD